jgi:hypothetical protein
MPDRAFPRPVLRELPLLSDPLLDGALELMGELVPEPEGAISESWGVTGGESSSGGLSLDGIATGRPEPRRDAGC